MELSLILFNTNSRTRNYHITKLIYAAACRKIGVENVHIANHSNVVELCRTHSNSVLLAVDGQRLHPALLVNAIKYVSVSILWQFDDPYNLTENVKNAEYFDHVYTNEPLAVNAYGGKATFLPLAGEIVTKPVLTESEKEFDVFFCGSAWPNRVVLLNRLLKARPELKWRICLTYNSQLPAMPLTLQESSYLQTLSFDDMLETAARSKITLDINRVFGGGDQGASNTSASFPGPRTFEIAGHGAFQFGINSPGLRQVFSDDEIPMCTDEEDLLTRLDDLLADPDMRENAAKKAQEKVRKTHLYDHRVEEIFEHCKSIREQKIKKTEFALLKYEKPKLLFVVHNTIKDGEFGGLEVHQDVVAKQLSYDYDICFLTAYKVSDGVEIALLDNNYNELKVKRINQKIDISSLLQNAQFESTFSEIISDRSIELVHFFHFLRVPPSLTRIAKAMGVPYTLSLHDYYPILRNFTLTDGNGIYLDGKVGQHNELDQMVSKDPGTSSGAYTRRHAAYNYVLSNAETIIYISQASKKIFEKAFPLIKNHASTRVHHAPIPSTNYKFFRAQKNTRKSSDSVSYVVLGNLAMHKGGNYLVDALSGLRSFTGSIHFHGSIDKAIKKRIEDELGDKAIFHGRYQSGSLDLTVYDFSLHLSTWPEVYCQTLSEAWAMGVVPIVTDIGALGDRVIHMENGLKVDYRNSSTLKALIEYIQVSPESFKHLRDIDTKGLFMDPPEAAAQYSEAFEMVLNRFSQSNSTDTILRDSVGISLHDIGRASRNNNWRVFESLQSNEPCRPLALNKLCWSYVSQDCVSSDNTVTGCLDSVRLQADASAKIEAIELTEDTINHNMFFDDTIEVSGWLNFDDLPSQEYTRPVLLLKSEGAEEWSVFNMQRDKRSDLGEYFSKEEASQWGVVGSAHLMNPCMMLSGELTLQIGLQSDEGKIVALPAIRKVDGHLRHRPSVGV